MLIPWGHDSSQLRRRPWVTYALGIVCVLAFALVTGEADDAILAEADEALWEAYGYWEAHPYLSGPDHLLRAIGPLPPEAEAFWANDLGGTRPDPAVTASQQAELEARVALAHSLVRNHAWYRFGLVPSDPSAVGLVSHMFLHSGLLHLIGNLWFLILAGPYIEDRFGRGMFAAFYLAAGLTGAAFFSAASPGFEGPLIGASGAVSGVLGAFLVCCRKVRIKFFYWIILPGRFTAPAWVMLPLWFGNELLSAFAMGDASPVAYWTHVGGFAFGAVAAVGIRAMGLEAQLTSELGELGADIGEDSASATRDAIRAGDLNEAVAVSSAALADGQADARSVAAYLEAVRAAGRESDARQTLSTHLWSAIDWRKKEAALAIWDALAELGVTPSGDSAALLQMASWLRGAGKAGESSLALGGALVGADTATALEIARAARKRDPVLVRRAAERALDSGTITESDRKAMEALLSESVQEANRRGWILLGEGEVVERGRGRPPRGGAAPRSPVAAAPSATPADPTSYEDELLGDAPAPLPLEGNDVSASLPPMDRESEAPATRAQGEAIDISDILGEDAPEPITLPDPETEGREAFLDSLHENLGAASGPAPSSGAPGADLDEGLFGTSEDLAGDFAERPDAAPMPSAIGSVPAPETLAPDEAVPDVVPEPSDPMIPAAPAAFADVPDEDDPNARTIALPRPQGAEDEDLPPGLDVADLDALFDEKEETSLPPRRLQIMAAVPLGIDETHLRLDVAGRGRSRLALERIDAVSVVGVKGLTDSGKAVLILDLCMNWTGLDDLQVVRMRSDAFDPRKLVTASDSPLKALRAFAALLVQRSRCVALPADSPPDAPFRIFADPATYHLDVLNATLPD